ncbi:MAG: antitoxin [Candidatus Accumulibacter sp.]|jgi:hypothetical protein|nr:antitoxin [Accumulibacter sp.]
MNKPLYLGINDAQINYEVALEILGDEMQPFISARNKEKEKTNPSPEFIAYCTARISALSNLEDDLRPDDTETIDMILDKDNKLFRKGA